MRIIVDPKWSKILKVVSIIMTILVFISMIIVFPLSKTLVDKEIAKAGYDAYEAKAFKSTVNVTLIIIMIGVIVFQAFVLVAGLRCSFNGEWRIGAIVFGIIGTVSGVFSFFKAVTIPVSLVINLISLVLEILYLVAAINCRPIILKDDTESNL